MRVSPEDIEGMVLQTFFSLAIAPGGKLHHSMLTKYWHRYRFRSRDFGQALANLISSGSITTENGTEDLVLVLTAAGHAKARADQERGWEGFKRALRWAWLAFSRNREDTGSKKRRPNRRLGRSTDRDSDQLRARADSNRRG